MKVFISHSSKDKEFVSRLAKDLRTRSGIDAWLDQWEIKPGDRIPKRVEQGLSEAEVLVLILSPDSVNSEWVGWERDAWLSMQIDEERRAKEEGRLPERRLIPVLYRECEKPTFLKPLLHVNISEQTYEDGFGRLVSAILEVPEKPPLKEESKAPTVPGLGPSRRKYVVTLLKSLLPGQFVEVAFIYDMSDAHLPAQVSQVEKAVALIRYAVQQEGESLVELLDAIYTVAPHLRR